MGLSGGIKGDGEATPAFLAAAADAPSWRCAGVRTTLSPGAAQACGHSLLAAAALQFEVVNLSEQDGRSKGRSR